MESKENIKLCKKCHNELDNNAIRCPNCKSYQQLPSWAIVIIIIVGIYFVSQLAGGFVDKNDSISNNSLNNSTNNVTNIPNVPENSVDNDIVLPTEKIYGFNETFFFDDLEITIGENYTFDTVRNKFSDYNNQLVVKLPITIKNNSSDTHGLNMFYYDIYGSNGTEVENLGSYFDDDIDYAGDLRSGASYTKYIYLQYDGDGIYAIEFDNYASNVTVEFSIVK